MDNNKIIQSLWIGEKLSNLEKLCIKSFLYNGHDFHLYVYDDINEVPENIIIKDANEIIKKSEIFLGQRNDNIFKGYEAFSDLFRYKLLYELGGWWVDLDVICIQPFDFNDNFIFASQKSSNKIEEIPSGCIMKSQKKTEEIKFCLDECYSFDDRSKIRYNDIGMKLIQKMIEKYNLKKYVKRSINFCPINFWEINKFIDPNYDFQITPDMYGIHCFNVKWHENGYEKDNVFDENSIFEQLKKYYAV